MTEAHFTVTGGLISAMVLSVVWRKPHKALPGFASRWHNLEENGILSASQEALFYFYALVSRSQFQLTPPLSEAALLST
jgi:hypothetical protein